MSKPGEVAGNHDRIKPIDQLARLGEMSAIHSSDAADRHSYRVNRNRVVPGDIVQ